MKGDKVMEIQHSGIKGQRWGIRRFQNEDGTLTERGKKRYGGKNYEKLNEKGKTKYRNDRFDGKVLEYAKAQSSGKIIAKKLLLGGWGEYAYDSLRMTGTSRKVAMGKTALASLVPVVGPMSLYLKTRKEYVRLEMDKEKR